VALGFETLWPLVWGLDLALAGACALDVARTPRPDRLAIDRAIPETVGLSRPFERRIELGLPRARNLSFRLFEAFPPDFEVQARSVDGRAEPPLADDPSGGPDLGRLDGEGRACAVRTYRGRRRGPFAFGDVRLRLRGPLGLIWRQRRLFGSQPIAVEPALPNLRRTLSLAASDRWHDLGVRHLWRRGGETEFESLREYVRGDDVRRVDWKAFARRGKPIVRDYQVERGQELVLLVDRGRRMRAATGGGRHRNWTKLDWALDAALELAAVALSKSDRVGAAVFSRGLDVFVSPAKGARQLVRLSRALFAQEPTSDDGDLGHALRELAARHRRRATVVVLSDVADPLSVERQRTALSRASRRHRVVFAALDDPDLRALAEGSPAPAAERAAALELVHDRRRGLRRLSSSGARVLDALPAEAAAPLLTAWLEERRG